MTDRYKQPAWQSSYRSNYKPKKRPKKRFKKTFTFYLLKPKEIPPACGKQAFKGEGWGARDRSPKSQAHGSSWAEMLIASANLMPSKPQPNWVEVDLATTNLYWPIPG